MGEITRSSGGGEEGEASTEYLEASTLTGTDTGVLSVSVDAALLRDVRRQVPFREVARQICW
jgi:hypothetical protein